MTFWMILPILHHLVLTLGDILVHLDGICPGEQSDLTIRFDGNDYSLLSEAERSMFNLRENDLINEIALCYGKRPESAYINSPTPWGDIYKKYGWTPVYKSMKPLKGRVLNVSWEPVNILQQVFRNKRQKRVMFSVGISLEPQNTASSSWNSEGTLSNFKNVSYKSNITVGNHGAVSFFSYNSSWGVNTNLSQTVTVGSILPMELLLEPNQSVTAQLYVTRVSIKYEIEYALSAVGQITMSYPDKYMDHYFHTVYIDYCRKKANVSNELVVREVIDMVINADTRMVVYDTTYLYKLMDVHL